MSHMEEHWLITFMAEGEGCNSLSLRNLEIH